MRLEYRKRGKNPEIRNIRGVMMRFISAVFGSKHFKKEKIKKTNTGSYLLLVEVGDRVELYEFKKQGNSLEMYSNVGGPDTKPIRTFTNIPEYMDENLAIQFIVDKYIHDMFGIIERGSTLPFFDKWIDEWRFREMIMVLGEPEEEISENNIVKQILHHTKLIQARNINVVSFDELMQPITIISYHPCKVEFQETEEITLTTHSVGHRRIALAVCENSKILFVNYKAIQSLINANLLPKNEMDWFDLLELLWICGFRLAKIVKMGKKMKVFEKKDKIDLIEIRLAQNIREKVKPVVHDLFMKIENARNGR